MTAFLTAIAGLAAALLIIAIGGIVMLYLAILIDKILDKHIDKFY